MSEMLRVENLKTYFDTRKGLVKAVDDISFSIDKGEILGIVGESGAGKSITGFSLIKYCRSCSIIESRNFIMCPPSLRIFDNL